MSCCTLTNRPFQTLGTETCKTLLYMFCFQQFAHHLVNALVTIFGILLHGFTNHITKRMWQRIQLRLSGQVFH